MESYKAGKWSPNTAVDEDDTDIMKFIGRSDFTPAKPQEATARIIGGGNVDESIGNDAHPVLFEYMKHFESQTKTGAVAPSATSHFIAEQITPPHGIAGSTNNIGAFDSHVPDRLHVNDIHSPGLRPGSYSTTQASNSTPWPSNSLYDDSHLNLDSLLGQTQNLSSQQPFPFHDLLSDHGSGFYQTNEQQLQDQVWEQFLSTLMPGEIALTLNEIKQYPSRTEFHPLGLP
ncbi:14637_t:CDS:2 [Acaulospora colombiana]|uniref:14637_t:CDS:1 n=1 Tax=Acaulospora colombiana TaxID=27376 RepID=A0ACA9MI00_9GLOM|nr:14637_t:CDS:2 [Acaulospora colombiana]